MPDAVEIYALLAEFDSADAVLAAARHVHAAGYVNAEAYTPFAVEGLADSLGFTYTRIPLITLIGGIIGGAGGFFMCWFANVVNYPWNIGGRPHNSWPAWIPITFELTVLFAALTAAIGMIVRNGLPRLHHPLFEAPEFLRATRDRFFIAIESKDPKFDKTTVRLFLASLGPLAVTDVLKTPGVHE